MRNDVKSFMIWAGCALAFAIMMVFFWWGKKEGYEKGMNDAWKERPGCTFVLTGLQNNNRVFRHLDSCTNHPIINVEKK